MATEERLYPYDNMELHPNLPPTYDLRMYDKFVSKAAPRPKRRTRTRDWLRTRAERAEGAFHTTLTMAQWAIHMTVRSESDPEVRAARESRMVEKWKRFHERLTKAGRVTRDAVRLRP